LEDFDLLAILYDCGQRIVREVGFYIVGQFDVRQHLTTDDLFLIFDYELLRFCQIVQAFLHIYTSVASKSRSFVSDMLGASEVTATP